MPDSSKRRDGTLAFQRHLRKEATDAENALWHILRNRELGGKKFRRQHQFGPYILDFFCPERNLVIEIDGGQHYEDDVANRDALRTRYLAANGLRVLRFTNTEVLLEADAVTEKILEVIQAPSA